MRRSVQIVVALMAVFLLVRPFDCLASPRSDQKAKDCCKKGNCKPTNPDDCCKATVQDGGQLLTSKAPEHPSPVLHVRHGRDAEFAIAAVGDGIAFLELHAPPGSPPYSRLNLPLLI